MQNLSNKVFLINIVMLISLAFTAIFIYCELLDAIDQIQDYYTKKTILLTCVVIPLYKVIKALYLELMKE